MTSSYFRFAIYFAFPLILSLNLVPTQVHAQVLRSSELFKTLASKDSLLFVQGFNECNMEALDSVIGENLKFYHDQSGTQDRAAFFKAFRQNLCSNPDIKPIRKLVSGSLEVYPLKNNGHIYGAIQRGVHEFYLRRPGQKLEFTSFAKFTHLWLLEDGKWKLDTSLSYDHQIPASTQ